MPERLRRKLLPTSTNSMPTEPNNSKLPVRLSTPRANAIEDPKAQTSKRAIHCPENELLCLLVPVQTEVFYSKSCLRIFLVCTLHQPPLGASGGALQCSPVSLHSLSRPRQNSAPFSGFSRLSPARTYTLCVLQSCFCLI